MFRAIYNYLSLFYQTFTQFLLYVKIKNEMNKNITVYILKSSFYTLFLLIFILITKPKKAILKFTLKASFDLNFLA